MASIAEDKEIEEGEILSNSDEEDKRSSSSSNSRHHRKRERTKSHHHKHHKPYPEKEKRTLKSSIHKPVPPAPPQPLPEIKPIYYPSVDIPPSSSKTSNLINIRMDNNSHGDNYTPRNNVHQHSNNLPTPSVFYSPNPNVYFPPNPKNFYTPNPEFYSHNPNEFYSPNPRSNNIEIVPEDSHRTTSLSHPTVKPSPKNHPGTTVGPKLNPKFDDDEMPTEFLFAYKGAKYQVIDSYEEVPNAPQSSPTIEMTIPLLINSGVPPTDGDLQLDVKEPSNDSQLSFLNLLNGREAPTEEDNSNELLTNLNPSLETIESDDWGFSTMDDNNSESEEFKALETNKEDFATGPTSIEIEAKKLALLKEYKCDLSTINNVCLMISRGDPLIKSQIRVVMVETLKDLQYKYFHKLKDFISQHNQ